MLGEEFRRLSDALDQARQNGETVDVDTAAIGAFFYQMQILWNEDAAIGPPTDE